MNNTVPPLLEGSTNFDTYEVKTMKLNNLRSDIITDGTATLSEGTLTGVNDPVNNQDAATKKYIDGFLADIETTVQFNDDGIFGGSQNFIFNDTTKLVTVNGTITDGTSSLSSGTLSNIIDPPLGGINSQIAIPKEYVDQFNKTVNTTTIITATDITYTGQQLVNGVIYRDPVNNGLLEPYSDVMPTAVDIIENMEGTPVAVGMTAPFYIKNITNDNDVYIYLRQNNGVLFISQEGLPEPTVIIPRNYVLHGEIFVVDTTALNEQVSIIVKSLTYDNVVGDIKSFRGIELSANLGGGGNEDYLGIVTNSLNEINKLYYPISDTTYADGNIVLDYPLTTREGQTTTSITNASNIQVSFKGPASTTVFNTDGYTRDGGFRYTIRNGSFQSSITVVASDGFIVDPNSNMTIGPGKDGIFWIYADSSTETVTIYTVGIVDREPFQWTTQSTPDNSYTGVVWGPGIGAGSGLFVAVSDSGIGNRVITSPDGETWTTQSVPVDNDWQSVAFSPTLARFVAVSNTGTGDRVMTSDDGVTWTSRTSAADSSWTEIVWAGGLSLFVAVAGSGVANVMTSSDGITWTSLTSGIDIQHVNWSVNLGVLVGSGSADMSFSFDGTTWTTATGTGDFDSISWAPEIGKFVAVRNEDLATATDALRPVNASTDGITWTSTADAMVSNQWTDVSWGAGLNMFVAVADSGSDDKAGTILDNNRSAISFNGTEWIAVRTPVNNSWESVAWSPELKKFVAVSSSGSGDRVMTGELNL